jgi:FMN reductase (NADPH)
MGTENHSHHGLQNETIRLMLRHASIRRFRDEDINDETIETIARAAQQAAFASQLYSIVLTRDRKRIPFGAPVLFTICVDIHKLELIMDRRRWSLVTNDLTLLIFGIQDAALMAQNMVLAAESIGLGTCFLGAAPHAAETLRKQYKLPKRVFPLVQLAVGYPAEEPPPRPRYPLKFVLFEEEYPVLSDADIEESMLVMDEGYIAQDYYKASNAMIKLSGDRRETFTYDDYNWTEHISRKWGQWFAEPEAALEPLKSCGFHVAGQQKDGKEIHSE